MIQSLADFLHIPEAEFLKYGCFNGFVNQDTPLFLSPYLLRRYRVGDFENAYDSVMEHFQEIFTLLAQSRGEDKAWRAAVDRLKYQEVREIGLGYSRLGIQGRAPSGSNKLRLLSGLKNLIDMHLTNPEEIAAVTIFEDHLGPDQMSDLLASNIKRHLARYSQTTLLLMGIDRSRLRRWRIRKETVFLPEHPYCKGKPILLVPVAILSALPRVSSLQKLPLLFSVGSAARRELRELITGVAKNVVRSVRTAAIRDRLSQKPELLREVIKAYGLELSKPYDLQNDPLGIVAWYGDATAMLKELPRATTGKVQTGIQLRTFIFELIAGIRRLVEKQGYWKTMYRTSGNGSARAPMRETSINLILGMLMERECGEAGVDLNMAPGVGNGEPDFKFSVGPLKGIVEVKRLAHSRLLSGALAQVVKYAEADAFDPLILLVVNNGGSLQRLERLKDRLNRDETLAPLHIALEYINGASQLSPSKDRG